MVSCDVGPPKGGRQLGGGQRIGRGVVAAHRHIRVEGPPKVLVRLGYRRPAEGARDIDCRIVGLRLHGRPSHGAAGVVGLDFARVDRWPASPWHRNRRHHVLRLLECPSLGQSDGAESSHHPPGGAGRRRGQGGLGLGGALGAQKRVRVAEALLGVIGGERGGALELLELAGLAVGEHRLDERGPRRAEPGEHLLSALAFDSDALASQQALDDARDDDLALGRGVRGAVERLEKQLGRLPLTRFPAQGHQRPRRRGGHPEVLQHAESASDARGILPGQNLAQAAEDHVVPVAQELGRRGPRGSDVCADDRDDTGHHDGDARLH